MPVERLKHEPLVYTVDHFFAPVCWPEPAPVVWAAPVAGGRLESEKLGSPAFGRDASALSRDCRGFLIGEVPHGLPADARVRIEEPLEQCGSGCVIMHAH